MNSTNLCVLRSTVYQEEIKLHRAFKFYISEDLVILFYSVFFFFLTCAQIATVN